MVLSTEGGTGHEAEGTIVAFCCGYHGRDCEQSEYQPRARRPKPRFSFRYGTWIQLRAKFEPLRAGTENIIHKYMRERQEGISSESVELSIMAFYVVSRRRSRRGASPRSAVVGHSWRAEHGILQLHTSAMDYWIAGEGVQLYNSGTMEAISPFWESERSMTLPMAARRRDLVRQRVLDSLRHNALLRHWCAILLLWKARAGRILGKVPLSVARDALRAGSSAKFNSGVQRAAEDLARDCAARSAIGSVAWGPIYPVL